MGVRLGRSERGRVVLKIHFLFVIIKDSMVFQLEKYVSSKKKLICFKLGSQTNLNLHNTI
jgi:hypothetical protein